MKVACCSRRAVQRLLDFFVGDRDFGLLGPQFLVALDLDLGHHFKTGFEAQGFVVLQVEVGDLWLRHRDQALLVGLFAEVARDQGLDHVALQVLGKTLADDGGGHVPAAEARDTRQLLIFLDQGFGLAGYFLERDFNLRSPAWCCCWSQWGSHLPFRLRAVRTVPFRN